MITFEEWWVMQFLPKEHRHAAEQSWNTCHREMERIANMRVAETIRTQQAEIERLKGQRDRLTGRLKESQSAVKLCLDKFMYTENVRMADKYHQMWTINSGLIAEIEAEK